VVGHPFTYEINTKSSSLRVEPPCGRPVPIITSPASLAASCRNSSSTPPRSVHLSSLEAKQREPASVSYLPVSSARSPMVHSGADTPEPLCSSPFPRCLRIAYPLAECPSKVLQGLTCGIRALERLECCRSVAILSEMATRDEKRAQAALLISSGMSVSQAAREMKIDRTRCTDGCASTRRSFAGARTTPPGLSAALNSWLL
jgi:hypothetical protein